VEGGDGGPGVVGVHVEAKRVGVEAGEVEGDGAGVQRGEGGIGAAGVRAGGVGEVCELGGVREDFGAGDAADPEELDGEGMQVFGAGKECGEGRAERERGDGGGVGAGVTVDAACVRAGRDAGEGHVVVVGAVGVVVLDDGGNGGEEGGGARVEGVVDVGAHSAAEWGDVDGIESGAEGDVRDGEEAGLRVKMEVSAGVVLAVHGAVEGSDGAVGLARFGWGPEVGGLGEDVRLEVGAEEVLGVDGEVEDDGGGDDGADGALGSDGKGGDVVGLVPVAVAGHAEAGPLGGFAVPAVGFVRDAPKVVEDLFAGGDVGCGEGRLAVDRVDDVELGAFGRVPAWVRRGVGVGGVVE